MAESNNQRDAKSAQDRANDFIGRLTGNHPGTATEKLKRALAKPSKAGEEEKRRAAQRERDQE